LPIKLQFLSFLICDFGRLTTSGSIQFKTHTSAVGASDANAPPSKICSAKLIKFG